MNCWLDCIQIWYDCSLGIPDDLITFWDQSSKKKWLPQPFQKQIDMVVVWVIFSHYLLILMDRANG